MASCWHNPQIFWACLIRILLFCYVMLCYDSLHPNGNVLATAGLDTMVKLWDLRKFGRHNSTNGKRNKSCLNSYSVGKSINSAFFSPSGRDLLTTTMAHTCDILTNFDIDSDMK